MSLLQTHKFTPLDPALASARAGLAEAEGAEALEQFRPRVASAQQLQQCVAAAHIRLSGAGGQQAPLRCAVRVSSVSSVSSVLLLPDSLT